VEPMLSHKPLRTEPFGQPFLTEKAARAGDPLEIGILVFQCPMTAREIESGIDMDRKTFIGIQNVNIRVHCSDCGEFHEWRVGEGILSCPGVAKKLEPVNTLCSKQRLLMERTANAGEPPELSSEQRIARELVKRIRKLRWIGEEEKARQLQAALSEMPPGESVLLLPVNTD